MRKLKKQTIENASGDYETWLIASLKNKKEAAVYLQVALDEYQKDGDMQALLIALRQVAKAQGGMAKLAERSHLNRESLYKTLSKNGNPKLQTLGMLLQGLGFHLTIAANKI